MSSEVLQEKLIRLRKEKNAVLKQIKEIKTERAKKSRKLIGLITIEPDSDADPEMRDLWLKVYDLKEQIEKVSFQLLKKDWLTAKKMEVTADKKAAINTIKAQRREA